MIRVEHVKRSDHDRYIRINQTLLTGRYFEEWGTLQYRLGHVIQNADNLKSIQYYDLFVAYVDGRLAGYCVYLPRHKGVEFYVSPRYRRQGVATELVKSVRKVTGLATLTAQSGFPGSREFFEANHIYVQGDIRIEQLRNKYDTGPWPMTPDEFVRAHKRAVKSFKLHMHNRLRKANAATAC